MTDGRGTSPGSGPQPPPTSIRNAADGSASVGAQVGVVDGNVYIYAVPPGAESGRVPGAGGTALRPANRRFVVTDIENWSGRSLQLQRNLRRRMTQMVQEGLDLIGLADQRRTAPYSQERGDGLLLAFDSSVSLLDLTDTFVDRLAALLRQDRREASAEARLRLRVAIHDGDVAFDGDVPIGQPVIEACQLVDADPLRQMLAEAQDADLAVIVSERVYRAVVADDLGRVPSSAYQQVEISLKNVRAQAWMHIPGTSRPPRPPFPGGIRTAPAPSPSPPRTPSDGTGHSQGAPVPESPLPAPATPPPGRAEPSTVLTNSPVTGTNVIIGSQVLHSFNGSPPAGRQQPDDPSRTP